MSGKQNRAGKINRRSEILRAAEKIMKANGLSGVTTRRISREVGCSEGALYVHFKGRLELLLAMLEECLPDMLITLRELGESVGRGSPQENLAGALGGIFKFHRRVVPIAAGLFAEPELLAAYRSSLARQGKGPHLSMKVLEDYIRSEQESGRIAAYMDAKLAAYLILASSFFRAFVEEFFETPMQPDWKHFAHQFIAAVAQKPLPRNQA